MHTPVKVKLDISGGPIKSQWAGGNIKGNTTGMGTSHLEMGEYMN